LPLTNVECNLGLNKERHVANFDIFPSSKDVEESWKKLRKNKYLGRFGGGGVSTDGEKGLQFYALTGRSPGSRSRIFEPRGRDIHTIDPTKTPEQMAAQPDGVLLYYQAMADADGLFVVSNGSQTPYVLENMQAGQSFEEAVSSAPVVMVEINGQLQEVDLSSYEPDPNFTPRITGFIRVEPNIATFGLAIAKRQHAGEGTERRFFTGDLTEVRPGVGFAVHTYKHNVPDDEILPPFEGDPVPVPLGETAEESAEMLWDMLDRENRVAVVARSIHLVTREVETHIIND
jgi:IMP cyclohydrolase